MTTHREDLALDNDRCGLLNHNTCALRDGDGIPTAVFNNLFASATSVFLCAAFCS